MPAPSRPAVNIINSDVQREHQFDMTSLAAFVVDNEQLLTAEQRNVSTYLLQQDKVDFFSGCTSIKKHLGMAEVLRKCKIIIWDECTMTHKHSLEALDRTLKNIKNNTRLFGGALLLLSDLRHNYTDHACLRERTILAAKNLDVDAINFKIQQSLPGNEVTFKSIDTVVDPDEVVNYPVEYLNSLDLPGMPPHNLRLKIRSPIILLRYLIAPKLCNDPQLVIKNHGQHS
ncbi:ATP-dependent DNA helicase [Trichonephila clavipes]|nr:ATP-dependent DNA helicase [Trichonephila clavipes]